MDFGCGGVNQAPLYSVEASRVSGLSDAAVAAAPDLDLLEQEDGVFLDRFATWARVDGDVVGLVGETDAAADLVGDAPVLDDGGATEGEPVLDLELVNASLGICKTDVAPAVVGILKTRKEQNETEKMNHKKRTEKLLLGWFEIRKKKKQKLGERQDEVSIRKQSDGLIGRLNRK